MENEINPPVMPPAEATITQAHQMPPLGRRFGIIIGVIVLLVLGGGAYAYIHFVGLPAPKEDISKIVSALQNITSYTGTSDVNIQVKVKDRVVGNSVFEQLISTAHAEGRFDMRDKVRPRGEIKITSKTSFQNKSYNIVGEAKIADNAVFFKLDQLPDEIKMFFDSKTFMNQWIRIALPEVPTDKQSDSPFNQLTQFPKYDAKKVKEIEDAFKKADLLKVTGRSKGDMREGEITKKITFTLDNKGAKNFIYEIGRIMDAPISNSDRDEIDKLFKMFQVSGEIYIGENTSLPYEYTIKAKVDDTEYFKDLGIEVKAVYSNYNKEVFIETPTQYKEFNDIMSSLYGNNWNQSLNPARQFAVANNSNRSSDINTILNAVKQYQVDNKGQIPALITNDAREICATGASDCSGLVDLSVLTNGENYIIRIPVDPLCPTGCDNNGVGYTIKKTANGRIMVSAPHAELGEPISVTR